MVREERIKAELDQLSNSIDFRVELKEAGVEVAGGKAQVQENTDDVVVPKEDRITANEIGVHDINS